MELVKPKNPDEFLTKFILRLEGLFLRVKGSFHLALAGGKTPLEAYRMLAGKLKTKPYLSDERFVPLEDERSNYKNIKETGLEVHPFPTHLGLMECAKVYSDILPSALDVVLLGIGEDGHTASLFLHMDCKEITHKVCASQSPDGLKRLSLSYGYLNKSCMVIFFVKGKQRMVQRLLQGEDLPANRVKGRKRTILIWS